MTDLALDGARDDTVTRDAVHLRNLPPTAGKSGITAWPGRLAPAATPEPVITKRHTVTSKLLRSSDLSEKFAVQGIDVIGGSPADFAAFLRQDVEKYAKLVKTAGIRID